MSLKLFCTASILIITVNLLIGCESKAKWEHFDQGAHIVLEVETKEDLSKDTGNMLKTTKILEKRLEGLGVKKRIVKMQGERKIIIQLPKLTNPERAIELIGRKGLLEFKLVDEEADFIKALEGQIPEGDEILYGREVDPVTKSVKQTIPYLLKSKAVMTGDVISDAVVSIDSDLNEPYVSLSFNSVGARVFEKVTGENVKRRLAIVLDKNVYSAPVIQEKIGGGKAQITGRFTMEEAQDLVIVLRAGALPTAVKIVEVRKLTRDIWLGDKD